MKLTLQALTVAGLLWVQAESRIRRLKGKKVRWEEYLRLYLPISIKAGFFTALGSISAAIILSEWLGKLTFMHPDFSLQSPAPTMGRILSPC